MRRGRGTRWHARWRDDAGAIAGFEALAFGVLIFVGGTLLIVNAWAVIDAKIAVSAAAREATRAFVETPAGASADQARVRATQVGLDTVAGHSVNRVAQVDVQMVGEAPGGGLIRCAQVTSTVTTHVPSVFVPFVGHLGGGVGFTVRASYSEVVDPYRSGLAAGGTCAF